MKPEPPEGSQLRERHSVVHLCALHATVALQASDRRPLNMPSRSTCVLCQGQEIWLDNYIVLPMCEGIMNKNEAFRF